MDIQQPSIISSESMTLAEARALFFARAGLGADGGYGARWVRIDAKPVPIIFPNTACRIVATKLHDLHHIATGYGTDWIGEGEIAAWELAGGCGRHGWAWLLDAGAFTVGLFLAPRRMRAAFVRGLGARNLYHGGFPEEQLASVTVAALRERIGVAPIVQVVRRERLVFAAAAAGAVGFHLAIGTAGIAMLWLAWRLLG